MSGVVGTAEFWTDDEELCMVDEERCMDDEGSPVVKTDVEEAAVDKVVAVEDAPTVELLLPGSAGHVSSSRLRRVGGSHRQA